jgi:hypothetical protein
MGPECFIFTPSKRLVWQISFCWTELDGTRVLYYHSLQAVRYFSNFHYDWWGCCLPPRKGFTTCDKFPFVGQSSMGPEWTSSHQCTSWLFYPLDGLCFFIWCQMGFIIVNFFSLLITFFFFFGFVFGYFFLGSDFTHSYPTHLPTLPMYCANLGTLLIIPYWHSYLNN